MSGPSEPTIKRLFAVSHNRCAFPKCTIPLVDPASGKVTGRVCHIKARSPNGPRYDKNQSNEQRHGFDNLLLLCPIHHDVVDADEVAYTEQRLTEMKRTHEAAGSPTPPSEDVLRQLLLQVQGNTSIGGSVIVSHNQTGGQIAHQIINHGPPPRTLEGRVLPSSIVDVMRERPLPDTNVSVVGTDSETVAMGNQICWALRELGWNSVVGPITTMAPRLNNAEIHLQSTSAPNDASDPLRLFAGWLASQGFRAVYVPGAETNSILVYPK